MTRTGETILQASAWHSGFPPVTAAPLRPKSLQTEPEKALRCSPGFGFAQHCALLLGRRALPYNPPRQLSCKKAGQRTFLRGARRRAAALFRADQPHWVRVFTAFRLLGGQAATTALLHAKPLPPTQASAPFAHCPSPRPATCPAGLRLGSSVTPGRAASPSAVCPAGGSAGAARSACRPCRSCSPPGSRSPGPGRRRFWEWPPTPWR